MPIEFLNENRFTAVMDGVEHIYMVISRSVGENGTERIVYMDAEAAKAGRYEAATGEIEARGSGCFLRPCAGEDPALDRLGHGLMQAMRLGALSPMAFAGAEDEEDRDGEDAWDGEPDVDDAEPEEAEEEYDPDADQPPEAEVVTEAMTAEERLLRAILGESVSENVSDRSAEFRLLELLLGIDPEEDQ